MKTVSIVIPVYNEKNTILKTLEEVMSSDTLTLRKEIIVVDDYSTDSTREILKNYDKKQSIKIIYQSQNLGKGAALKKGLNLTKGDIVIIQDADLEYSPSDYPHLLK